MSDTYHHYAKMIEDPNYMGHQLPTMIEDSAAMLMWEGQIKLIPRRQLTLQIETVKAYTLIWDQCSLMMRSKLEQLPKYNALNTNKNPIKLLSKMRNIVCGHESHKQPVYSMVQLMKELCFEFQHDESNEKYKEKFEGMWDSITHQQWSHQPYGLHIRESPRAGKDERPCHHQCWCHPNGHHTNWEQSQGLLQAKWVK